MNTYKVAEVFLISEKLPKVFDAFITSEEPVGSPVIVTFSENRFDIPKESVETSNFNFNNYRLKDGSWIFTTTHSDVMLRASSDYTKAEIFSTCGLDDTELELLLRIIIECRMILGGNVSLHSSCVEKDGKAICFSGVSGIGKSTRAEQWINALGYQFISGDRPAMLISKKIVCGAPWDGKEGIHRNESADIAAIFDVRRSSFTKVRKVTPSQAYNFLIKQIFVPMWDSETSMYAFVNLRRLTRTIPVYRVFCGPDENAAREVFDIVFKNKNKILQEDKDMKIKDDFIVRDMLGEYMAIPTGDNIAKFDGSVVLNDVSAFIIEKLKAPISKEDLLDLILDEYDVERATAEADLDALLKKLDEYGMLEN